jgi:hypothetical protein
MNAIKPWSAAIVIFLGLPVPLAALAQEHAQGVPSRAEWTPIDPVRLMHMRGGLQMPSGLSLSFGIERAVYVNGELVARANLHIPDISRISTEQATALAAMNEGMVVRVGDGNTLDANGMGNGLVIQNTLDGQDIQAITTLDVGVDTLGMLQEMNTYDALQNALLGAPGGP